MSAKKERNDIPSDKLPLYDELIKRTQTLKGKGVSYPILPSTVTCSLSVPNPVQENLLKNTKELKKYLEISYEYVKTLKPKAQKISKKKISKS
jgi:hypothetical protein